MERVSQFWNKKRVLILLCITIAIFAGLGSFLWSRVSHSIAAPEISIQTRHDLPISDRRPLLHTVHLSDDARDRILDVEFAISTSVRDIKPECNLIFQSALVDVGSKQQRSETVEFANPGQPFQDSDIITPGRPFRRLIFVGQSKDRCFIYYQHGGVMYPRFCLVVIDEPGKKVVWAGEQRKEAHSLHELRESLNHSDFYDTSGWSC